MQGYKAIAELMRRGEHGTVFSVLGAGNAAWVGYGVQEGFFELIKTRHEETAVDAAAAYAKTTGQVGLCTVARGPGFSNSITALATAARGHHPVLMVVTQSPTPNTTRQQIDQRGLTEILGGSFHHVATPQELEDQYWSAMAEARWGGRVQVLSLADDVLVGDVQLGAGSSGHSPPEPTVPDADVIRRAVTVLHEAERPLILAGQGAVVADCRKELEELAALSGAHLATSLLANRFFSGHPHDLGICGSWSPPVSREIIMESDVVLAMGASLNKDTRAGGSAFGSAVVIHCEVDPDRPCFSSSPELALLADAREAAQAIISAWHDMGFAPKGAPNRTDVWADNRRALLDADIAHVPERGLDTRKVVDFIHRKLPANRIVAVDAGRNCGGPLYSLIDAQDSHSFVVSNAYGSIGRGLGYAVGAAAAHRDRRVVLFCGDGGFMMAAQGLDAIKLNELDVLVVIFNNEQYASDSTHLTVHGLPLDVVTQPMPDVQMLAETFGGQGFSVRTQDELESLEIPNHGLVLVEAMVDPVLNVRDALG